MMPSSAISRDESLRRDDDAWELDRRLADDFDGDEDIDLARGFIIAARGVLSSLLGLLLFVGVEGSAMWLAFDSGVKRYGRLCCRGRLMSQEVLS